MALQIAPVSSTALNVSVIREKPNAANVYAIDFADHPDLWICEIYQNVGNQFCVFDDLEPATEYTFEVHARAFASGFDIASEKKYFSGYTLSNCEFICLFLFECMYFLCNFQYKIYHMSFLERQAVYIKTTSFFK